MYQKLKLSLPYRLLNNFSFSFTASKSESISGIALTSISNGVQLARAVEAKIERNPFGQFSTHRSLAHLKLFEGRVLPENEGWDLAVFRKYLTLSSQDVSFLYKTTIYFLETF